MRILFLVFLFLSFILSGCHVGPIYEPPPLASPDEWKCGPKEEPPLPVVENWWEIFQDPCLNELEKKALENSPNIYVAYSKIVEARGFVKFEKANFLPTLTLRPRYSNTERLVQLFGVPDTVPGVEEIFRAHQLEYLFPLDMFYEIDLWGRLRDQYDTTYRFMEAQSQGLRVALLTLSADLASHYFNIRTLDAQSLFYMKEIELRRQNLELTQTRFEEGLISHLDVSSAALLLANLEADYTDLLRQRTLHEDAIAALMGVFAPEFSLPCALIEVPPPTIPPGVPCSILLKRPDIRQAERRRAAAHALIGVAYATFFPSLTITGTLGFFSPTIKDFLTWKSRLWRVGISILQNVFDGGRRKGLLESARGRFEEEDGNYQKTVLTAFQEVQDALNNLEWQERQFAFLNHATLAAKERSSLALSRYLEGLTNYIEVVDSERSVAEAELYLFNILGARYQSTIQLIKAIGGSWENQAVPCLNN